MPKHANDRALDTVSLRDYFAAAALPALLAHYAAVPSEAQLEEVTETAYDVADAMLAERVADDDAD